MSNLTSDKAILACIDGSNVTESVCDYAAWYAKQLDLPISLLHVIDVPKQSQSDLSGAIGMDSHKQLLQDLAQLDEQTARVANKRGDALLKSAKDYILQDDNSAQVHTHLRHSKLLPAVEHLIKKGTRAIILGRRGKDSQKSRLSIGSQIETIVRAVSCPILVCSDDFQTPNSFMLAFDGSATAKKAVKIICENELAKTLQGHLVMVGNKDSDYETELYKAQKQMCEAGIEVSTHIIDSKSSGYKGVVSTLIEFRKKHDISLFVIGAYGHSKLRQFFVGSTTTKLLAQTTAPVVLLR